MGPRPSSAWLRPLLIALAVAAPAATALAVGETSTPAIPPATSPTRTVGEQVGTARAIVPFGASHDDGRTITFAVGQTRGPAPELPVAPSTPRLVRTTPEPTLELPPTEEPPTTTDEEEGPKDGEAEGKRLQDEATPQPSTPIANVLLEGTTRTPDAPTAWKRATLPLDASGTALKAGGWRPAGAQPATAERAMGSASQHAGEATPRGAAALLVAVAPADGGPETSEILVRTADRGFRLLPAPPAALLAPAEQLSNPEAERQFAPLAAFDVAVPDGASPTYGRTGVLIAPPGGDGVLVWDGTTWTEEPYVDATGTATQPATSTPALAATPDGDAVALAGTPLGTDRITLLRRLPDGAGWRPMKLDAPLLSGPLPKGLNEVKPVEQPGDPLTVAPGHWWLDVRVQADDGVFYAATLHLEPGPAPVSADISTTPAPETTPLPTATDPSTPDPTSPPASGAATMPASLVAEETRTWCEGKRAAGAYEPGFAPALCDAELPGRFSTFDGARGYRSIAFAGQGLLPDGTAPTTPSSEAPLGGRVITNPILGSNDNSQAVPDLTASGGYLRLDGDQFTLRGGIGESFSADNLTQAAAFLSDRLGWTGGRRVIGHVTTASDPDAATYVGTTPVSYEPVIDVARAPAFGSIAPGAAVLSASSVRRVYDDGRTPDNGDGLYSVVAESQVRAPRAIAWPQPDTIYFVGTNGLIAQMRPPTARSIADDTASIQTPTIIPGFEGLDFTDVAFADEPDPVRLDGWAVGLEGAAVHFGPGGGAERVSLPEPFAQADLRQVAYAGSTAYITSNVGLFAARRPGSDTLPVFSLELDRELVALMAEDDRLPDVDVVAGLPDGTVVVDGRYVKPSASARWQRLASPAEGDVVALAISRDPADQNGGLSGLRIQASISDAPRPRRGEITRRQVSEDDWADVESPVFAFDGRHTELTADGWIDRVRTPLDIGGQADATVPDIPTQAITAGPSGGGWAATGVGGSLYDDYDLLIRVPRGGLTNLSTPHVNGPTAVPAARAGVDASRTRRAGRPATRAQDALTPSTPAPTSTTPPPGTAPAPSVPAPPITPAGPGSAPIRILIGGHPACFDACTGRADQRVGPTETLRQALQTAARLRELGGPAAPRAFVVGGGRTARQRGASDRIEARDYVDFLRGVPGTPPVYAAIGSGDQWSEGGRSTFASEVASPLRPTAADGVVPVTDPAPPAGNTVAYAFDVPGAEGGGARIVVADTTDAPDENGNATPTPWTSGPHGEWLDAVLRDANAKGLPTVVIGAAPIDRDPAAEGKIGFLLGHRVYAYVSTDGADDPYKIDFGPRERRRTIAGAGGEELLLLHTSALGHDLPVPTVNRHQRELMSDDSNGPMTDRVVPSILELSIPPERASLRRIVPRSIPVFRTFFTPESRPLAVGEAGGVSLPTAVDDDNGIRYTDEFNPAAAPVAAWGFGVGDAAPYPCRMWQTPEECGEEIDSVGQFAVADPTIADFARARVSKKNKNGPPEIITDADGNPIRDANSPILCALKAGTTTATATVAGRTVTMPVRVVERPASMPDPKGKCAFLWGRRDDREVAAPAAQPPPQATKPVVPGITAPQPDPKPLPKPTKSPQPPPQPISALPIVAPVFAVPIASAQEPTPTVAPNPKPFTTPPTPTPPSGVNSHAYLQAPSPMMQFQVATAMQEQRREQLARESAEHHATIYRAEPRSPLVPALVGGAGLALLVGAAGHAAGRRRALSRAAQRRWVG